MGECICSHIKQKTQRPKTFFLLTELFLILFFCWIEKKKKDLPKELDTAPAQWGHHFRSRSNREKLGTQVSNALDLWGLSPFSQVAEDFSTLKMLFHPAFYLISMGKNQVVPK